MVRARAVYPKCSPASTSLAHRWISSRGRVGDVLILKRPRIGAFTVPLPHANVGHGGPRLRGDSARTVCRSSIEILSRTTRKPCGVARRPVGR